MLPIPERVPPDRDRDLSWWLRCAMRGLAFHHLVKHLSVGRVSGPNLRPEPRANSKAQLQFMRQPLDQYRRRREQWILRRRLETLTRFRRSKARSPVDDPKRNGRFSRPNAAGSNAAVVEIQIRSPWPLDHCRYTSVRGDEANRRRKCVSYSDRLGRGYRGNNGRRISAAIPRAVTFAWYTGAPSRLLSVTTRAARRKC
jgi:hypothetical protein